MTLPSHVVVKGQIAHDKGNENDVYVTKASSIAGVVAILERKLRTFGSVNVHAIGAANYKALKICVAICKAHPGILKTEIETGTVETRDFLIPTTAQAQREIKERNVNSVKITITKI